MNLLFIHLFLFFIPFSIIAQENVISNALSACYLEPAELRLHNIELMRNVLKDRQYTGYDIIIISSTTEEEAEYQQLFIEKAFEGCSKENGAAPLILSVVDSTEGGQLIGAVYTWLKAEEKLREKQPDLMIGYSNFLDYIRATRSKVAVYHNGGKGERCSPLTQSLGNSRGSQKLVGTVMNAKGEIIELDVLLGVILQCSSFAITNLGTHIDTFWTSQIAFGSHAHDKLIRSNFVIDKFLVGFDQTNLIAQNIADFGTAALNEEGRMVAFYGNKKFASRKGNQYVIDTDKIEKELLSKGKLFAYDFGSFTASIEMWKILIDYWLRKDVFQPMLEGERHTRIKRDIDPHFVQPFIHFLYGMNDLISRDGLDDELVSPSNLLTQNDLNIASKEFDTILKRKMPTVHGYIWEDIYQEKDEKKKTEAMACMNEVIEFYLLYRETSAFKDLKKVFGFINLGDETQWFRYRRPIDIMNEKSEMLSDLIGKKIETQLNGSVKEFELDDTLIKRSYEARLMRGIKESEFAKFTVDGKVITMTLDEVKRGKMIEDVYIKNSIVQNCDLMRGSFIVNSVVNQVIGQVIVNNSYLESSIASLIEAMTSVIHQVVDVGQIKADREVVSDVYKSELKPAYHGRMRAPIGYDPKGMPIYKLLSTENKGCIDSPAMDEAIQYFIERLPYDLNGIKEFSDKTARTEDGRFTFEDIREIISSRRADELFRESLKVIAKKAVMNKRLSAICLSSVCSN